MKPFPFPAVAVLLALSLTAAGAAEIALPAWQHLSSRNGDLPAPNGGTQQTACVTFDIDGDGAADIVIAERTQAPAIIWLRHTARGWEKFVIDDTFQTPEAGGVAHDVDGDGDLDLILGGDYRSDEMWWYENPRPDFHPKTPWKRHLIHKGAGKARHDQAVADFKGAGKPQLVFWNQGARKLLMAEIPDRPRAAESWPVTELLDTSKVKSAIKQEGMAAFDVDGDGKVDLLAGIYWFKHEGGNKFKPIQIADHPGRIAAGRFKPGKIAQIVLAPGDGNGPLWFLECQGDPTNPQSWTRRDLLGREVIHGHSLALADLNGDGHLDILCGEMARWGRAPEPDHPGAKSWILYGDGQGDFKVTLFTTGFGFHEARVADVNGDGRLDVVSKPYSWNTPRLDLWLNLGNLPGATGSGGRYEPSTPRKP